MACSKSDDNNGAYTYESKPVAFPHVADRNDEGDWVEFRAKELHREATRKPLVRGILFFKNHKNTQQRMMLF